MGKFMMVRQERASRNISVGLFLGALLTWGAACDEAEGSEMEHGEHGTDMPKNICDDEERADDYRLGLSASGSIFTATFVDAMPAPPDKGDNRWEIALSDASGTPVEGAEITVLPFMPDHGHGTSVMAEVSPGEAPGLYILDPVNLHMAGLWEIRLSISLDLEGGEVSEDSVLFSFCVEA